MQDRDELSTLEWVRELESQPYMEQVLTAGALLSKTSVLPEDHIVRACSCSSRYNKDRSHERQQELARSAVQSRSSVQSGLVLLRSLHVACSSRRSWMLDCCGTYSACTTAKRSNTMQL